MLTLPQHGMLPGLLQQAAEKYGTWSRLFWGDYVAVALAVSICSCCV